MSIPKGATHRDKDGDYWKIEGGEYYYWDSFFETFFLMGGGCFDPEPPLNPIRKPSDHSFTHTECAPLPKTESRTVRMDDRRPWCDGAFVAGPAVKYSQRMRIASIANTAILKMMGG